MESSFPRTPCGRSSTSIWNARERASAPAGDIPFTEPSLEDLVEMVKEGKLGKEVLGDDADIMLQYGTPAQRRKQLEDTGSLEIPVIPFQSGKQFLDSYRTPPG